MTSREEVYGDGFPPLTPEEQGAYDKLVNNACSQIDKSLRLIEGAIRSLPSATTEHSISPDTML